jgi:hypothetical protein
MLLGSGWRRTGSGTTIPMRPVVALLAGALIVPGCPCDERAAIEVSAPGVRIDERAGTVGRAALGDGPRELRRAFGRPQAEGENVRSMPRELDTADIGVPWSVAPPPEIKGVTLARYDGMSVDIARPHGAYVFFVWRPGSRTASGIRIGDDLESVRERHPGFRCGVRNRNSEYAPYPFCEGRVGDTHVWFGQDPIRSITLSTTPLS